MREAKTRQTESPRRCFDRCLALKFFCRLSLLPEHPSSTRFRSAAQSTKSVSAVLSLFSVGVTVLGIPRSTCSPSPKSKGSLRSKSAAENDESIAKMLDPPNLSLLSEDVRPSSLLPSILCLLPL